jgi:hypothetical protein
MPRGFNYIRLDDPPGGKHTTLALGGYDAERAARMLADASRAGFNCVRVFVSVESGLPGSAYYRTPDGGVSAEFVGNFVSFLRLARAHGVLVVPTFEGQPMTERYRRMAALARRGVSPGNLMYLDSGRVEAREAFFVEFLSAAKERDEGALSAVLAFDIQNESCFRVGYPFTSPGGAFAAADGRVYDLAREKSELADDAAVWWTDRMCDAIRSVLPEALIDVNVFTYNAVGRSGPGDFSVKDEGWRNRYPFRPLSLVRSKADIIDIHLYPGDEAEYSADLRSIEFEELSRAAARRGKVLFVGEFGAFKARFPRVGDAAAWMSRLAPRIVEDGFAGWLYWTYDGLEQERLWHAKESDGAIFRALRRTLAPEARGGAR